MLTFPQGETSGWPHALSGRRNAEEDAMGARVSIGDFAVMTSLSRKALRHYHDIGILEPADIDLHTGYRFYDTS